MDLTLEGKMLQPVNIGLSLSCAVMDRNLYVGTDLNASKGARGAFGGHVLAHAMKAALLSMGETETFLINSVHAYYINPIRPDRVVYIIDTTKNGRTFCFRGVRAVQDGKTGFKCLVSFKLPDSRDGHLPYLSCPMPNVPGPEDPLTVPVDSVYCVAQETLPVPKISSNAPLQCLDIRYCIPDNWKELLANHTPTEPK